MEKQDVPNARDEIRKLQEALKGKAKIPAPGSTDGIMAKRTRAALKAFQKANGLKASGRLDGPTAEKLGVQKPTQANTK